MIHRTFLKRGNARMAKRKERGILRPQDTKKCLLKL